MRQAASVLNANGDAFSVHTPARSVRLVSDTSSQTFVEFALDTTGPQSQVIGRVSLTRGRQALVVEERPVVSGKKISALTEEDVSAFLVSEIPKLVLRPSWRCFQSIYSPWIRDRAFRGAPRCADARGCSAAGHCRNR
jgi:hypothetical protein